MTLRIPVLLGSSRIGRQSPRVAHCVVGKLRARGSIRTELLDLAQYRFPVMEQRLHEMEQPPAGLREFSEKLSQADAILIVAPEYKNGYPGVLKNALDYLDPGIFNHKPIAICTVSSGGFGGMNCLAQLRLVCLALGGTPIPATCAVSKVQEAFDVEGRLQDSRLENRIDSLIQELLWYAEALATQRKKSGGFRPSRNTVLNTVGANEGEE